MFQPFSQGAKGARTDRTPPLSPRFERGTDRTPPLGPQNYGRDQQTNQGWGSAEDNRNAVQPMEGIHTHVNTSKFNIIRHA